jgi:hypothetical protein
MAWEPTHITRYVEARQSSTQVVIVDTDEGRGFLKAMGNPEGEHALACDWVGTQLASWFGLPTFDQAIVNVDEFVEIKFLNGNFAENGPALVSRAISGEPWSGSKRQLKKISNKDDISRLVVFDTWILNRDRYSTNRLNRDNVFLSAENEELTLLAIDHTHCFGSSGGELTERVSRIENYKDGAIYGLFPEFEKWLKRKVVSQCCDRLSKMDETIAQSMVGNLPRQWKVSSKVKAALSKFIVQRAGFVSETIKDKFWPQRELDFMDESKDS